MSYDKITRVLLVCLPSSKYYSCVCRSWVLGCFRFLVQHKFFPGISKWRHWNHLLSFFIIQFQCGAVDLPTGAGYYEEFHRSLLHSIQQWPWLPQLQHLSATKPITTAFYLHLQWCLLLHCSRRSRSDADSAHWHLLPHILW